MSSVFCQSKSVALIELFVCLIVSVELIRICCDAAPSAMSSCNADIPSRTASAVIVIEGRTRRVEAVPSWIARTSASGGGGPFESNDYFNVTVKPRTVFKGELPRDSPIGYLPIVIGEFAPDEDRENCIPSVRLGSRYLFFLDGSGVPSSSNRLTPFYRLVGFPAAVSNETITLARDYSCKTCTSAPSVVMFPEKMQLELMWRRKLHLRCSASGRPIPRVIWTKDGHEVTPSGRLQIKNFTHRAGSHLRIAEVMAEDRGSYQCEAINVLGRSYSNSTVVTVQTNLPTKPHAELCTTLNYCLNGGICYILPAIGRKFCVCKDQFGGSRCQDQLTNTFLSDFVRGRSQFETMLIPFLLFIVVCILVILCLLLCVLLCRGTNDRKSSASNLRSVSKKSSARNQTTSLIEGPLLISNHVTIRTDSHSTQTDQYSVVNSERHQRPKSSSSDMKSSQSNGCHKVFSDDKPPPLPVKRSAAAAAAQSSFRQRMGGVSEDGGAEHIKTDGPGVDSSAVDGGPPVDTTSSEQSKSATYNINKPSSSLNDILNGGGCHGDKTEQCVRAVGNKTSVGSRPMSEVLDHVVSKQSTDALFPTSDCVLSPMSESGTCHQQSRFGELIALRKANPVMNLCRLPSGGLLENPLESAKQVACEDDYNGRAPYQSNVQESFCEDGGFLSPADNCSNCDVSGNTNGSFCDADMVKHRNMVCKDGVRKPFGQITFPLSEVDINCRRVPSECGTGGMRSSQANSLLPDRRMSEYEFSRSLAASDLEVNMESEVDVQGLNASEEDVCGDERAGRSRPRTGLYYCNRRRRDESSFDSSESETSESSLDHDQSPFRRTRPRRNGCQKSLADSLADDEQQSHGDWDRLLCSAFNPPPDGVTKSSLGPKETFSLNRCDLMYAHKYAMRCRPKQTADGDTSADVDKSDGVNLDLYDSDAVPAGDILSPDVDFEAEFVRDSSPGAVASIFDISDILPTSEANDSNASNAEEPSLKSILTCGRESRATADDVPLYPYDPDPEATVV